MGRIMAELRCERLGRRMKNDVWVLPQRSHRAGLSPAEREAFVAHGGTFLALWPSSRHTRLRIGQHAGRRCRPSGCRKHHARQHVGRYARSNLLPPLSTEGRNRKAESSRSQRTNQLNKPKGFDNRHLVNALALECGVSIATVALKLKSDKTPDQIRPEAKEWHLKEKKQSENTDESFS